MRNAPAAAAGAVPARPERALHFFARAAWQYVLKGENAARNAWRATPQRPFGEEADPAHALALRGRGEVLDEAFVALAEAVYGPLRAHLQDERL